MNSSAQLWFICVNLLFVCIYCAKCEISAENSRVWGPGLKSYFTVPVRFFYIHAVKTSGENFTESPAEGPFAVGIYQKDTGHLARVATEILDRNDGTFLVRYKLYETYRDLKVEVVLKTSGKHVSKSPYILKGNVYHEACYCPVDNTEKWMKALQCRDTEKQVERDLSLFDKVDMSKVEKEVLERYNRPHSYSLCHYVVKDNKIYRKTYGEHVGFKIFMDAILLSLTRKVVLPDIEMFVNLGDWPLEKKSSNGNALPIFSWCGSDDTNDIIMPTYDLTESTLETMGRVSLDLMSVQGNTGPTWDKKNDTAIWRGRDSREERLQLVKMSRKHPEVIDAALTNMFFFPENKKDYGEIVPHMSFFDFFKYKYQISIDGTVAAYRLPYLLAGDSVVLKQDSPYYEHFYKDLVPMKHFVPFKRDLSNLMDKLTWTKEHQDEEYSKKLTRPVAPQEDMELVAHPNGAESHCKCSRSKNSKTQKRKDEL